MSDIINNKLNQFSWAVAAILLLPLLFTKGMFLDGLTFATIARNMEEGLGTFWSPYYTNCVHPEYYLNPPFSFSIHSIFYRLFGDQPWVDRFYAYTLYGLSILMLRRIWSLFMPAGHRAWIPQLLWTVTPTVIWVHQNNMLEAPLAAATLATTWLVIEGTLKRNYLWSAIAGVLLFVSLGIKGPSGLFVLVVLPLLAVLFSEHRKASVLSGLVMITTFSMLFSFFYVYQSDFHTFIEGYLKEQLIPLLNGTHEKVGSAGASLWTLMKQLATPVVVLIVFRLRNKGSYTLRREALFFFIIALFATVPIFISDRQHHYDFMVSMSFWMLGFAIILEQNPWPWSIQRKKWSTRIAYTNLALWTVAIAMSLYYSKSPSRDRHVIKAFKAISAAHPEAHIQVQEINHHWKLVAIAARYENIQICESPQDLLLTTDPSDAPTGYELDSSYPKAHITLYKKATP